MADRAKKISELTALTSVDGGDLLVIVDSPSSDPVTKKITVSNLLYAGGVNVKATAVKTTTVPSTANSSGVAGDICYDSSYLYVCVANNVWKRADLNTW